MESATIPLLNTLAPVGSVRTSQSIWADINAIGVAIDRLGAAAGPEVDADEVVVVFELTVAAAVAAVINPSTS
jgi:hypothetical protein